MPSPLAASTTESAAVGTLLPGPARRAFGLPLLRATWQDPLAVLERLPAQFPDLCVTRILHETLVDVFHPALARALLVEHASRLDRWRRIPEVFGEYHGRGSVLAAEGADWQRLHAALAPAFTPRALDGLAEAAATLAEAAVRQALVESARGDGGVDVEPLFTRLTMQVIEQFLFGQHTTDAAMLDALGADIRMLSQRAMRDFHRPWAWLRRWPGPGQSARRAALTRLRHFVAGRPTKLALASLTPTERADNLLTLFLAGHDTTARSMLWWCALMAHHPQALAWAQHEVDEQLAGHPPVAEDLRRLPRLQATLKEALRLYPAAPLLAARRLREPVNLGRWVIPSGALVRIAPWVTQRDERWWASAREFRPERFLIDDPSAPASTPPGAWMPFGAGERACLGRHLAQLEMGVTAAVLLQRCTPTPLAGASLPAPELQVTLRPRQAVRLRLVPRDSPIQASCDPRPMRHTTHTTWRVSP